MKTSEGEEEGEEKAVRSALPSSTEGCWSCCLGSGTGVRYWRVRVLG